MNLLTEKLKAIRPAAKDYAGLLGETVSQAVLGDPNPRAGGAGGVDGFIVRMVGALAFCRVYEEQLLETIARADRTTPGHGFGAEVEALAADLAAELRREAEAFKKASGR